MTSPRLRRVLGGAAGALTALLAWEVALHPIARELRHPPRPDVGCDSVNSPPVATRQTEEGVAVARYSECGARLTGSSPSPGAPWLVLLGDSHLAAREVNDDETMGAQLVGIARAEGNAINVRQYGWGGSSAAQYVVSAPEVLRRWRPERVIVLLSFDDFGADTAFGLPPRFRIDGARVVLDTADPSRGRGVPPAQASALLSLSERRWSMTLARAPRRVREFAAKFAPRGEPDAHMDENPRAEVADAAVLALRKAYGPRVILVYLADVRATGDGAVPAEAMLLDACARYAVRCISTRAAMIAARDKGILARGFSTTVIGIGHLNANGHAIVAREIWKAIR